MSNSFRQLHRPGQPFILANAWDVGSAKMLVALGAKAIATSSAAHAFTIGKPDLGQVTREQALEHARSLVEAVDVPISADLENGYSETAEGVAETIRLAAECGLAGACIEDTDLPSTGAYSFEHSVARIEAAVEAARAAEQDFVLVARADGVMHGTYSLDEAIRRIQVFEEAGADVLYVPVPGSIEAQRQVCEAVQAPVNALCAGNLARQTMADFADAGVARVSLGSTLARATHRVLFDAANAMFEDGHFEPLRAVIAGSTVDELLLR